MTAATSVVLVAGFALAFANGANDVSKGVATLVGSGVTDYRRALHWGALWTLLGGLAGALIAGAMVTTFGDGILAPGTTSTLAAAVATLIGAALWVLVANRAGLPVSTTHAIVGALIGVGAAAYGLDGVRWSTIVAKIALPLLATPVLALVLAKAGLALSRRAGLASGEDDCVCVDVAPTVAASAAGGGAVAAGAELRITRATARECAKTRPHAAGLTLSSVHWLSSGATCFARGANDAPKIAALVVAAAAVSPGPELGAPSVFGVVTAGMVVGSLIRGRRVTELLAEKVTPLDHAQGFGANLVTASLVTAGAMFGLPMSTTHVSSGAIVGVASPRGPAALNRSTLRSMLLAWVATLPGAALLGVVAHAVATRLM